MESMTEKEVMKHISDKKWKAMAETKTDVASDNLSKALARKPGYKKKVVVAPTSPPPPPSPPPPVAEAVELSKAKQLEALCKEDVAKNPRKLRRVKNYWIDEEIIRVTECDITISSFEYAKLLKRESDTKDLINKIMSIKLLCDLVVAD